MIDDFKALLPQDKGDTDKANSIIALGYPTIAPILPKLMEWLQDYNWPVAQVLSPFLATIGVPLVSEVRRVLNTNDAVWKYWILLHIVEECEELAHRLRPELVRLATEPTISEQEEELSIIASRILTSLGSNPVHNLPPEM